MRPSLNVFTVVQTAECEWVVVDDHGEERHVTPYLSSAYEWAALLTDQDYEHSCPVCRGEARPVGEDPDYTPDNYPTCAVCGDFLEDGEGWANYHSSGATSHYCWCCGLRRGFPLPITPRA